jgi:hypothetical protein
MLPSGAPTGSALRTGSEGEDEARREGLVARAGGADVGLEGDEEVEDDGEDDVIEEGDAGGGEEEGEREEEVDESAFAVIEPRRDEEPELVEDPGRADEGRGDEAHLEVGVKGFERGGGDEVWRLPGVDEGVLDGCDDDLEEGFSEVEGDAEDGEQAVDGEEDALSQLVEVLPEGHGGGGGGSRGHGKCVPGEASDEGTRRGPMYEARFSDVVCSE